MVGVEFLTPVEGEIGPCMLRLPGIPRGIFLPYPVWGIWFIVERILTHSPPVALITEDMGLGKTHSALATLRYLKHIVDEAGAGRPLAYLRGKSVQELEEVLWIFGNNIEVYRQPSIIILPTNLVPAWEQAVQSLIPPTGVTLINFCSRRRLTYNNLNYSSDNPKRSKALHLISYSAYRTRCHNSECLLGCNWGVGIFDESHTAKSWVTQTFDSLMKIDVPCCIQLTRTPIHDMVGDWVVQTQWLFTQVTDEDEHDSHGPRPLDPAIAEANCENTTLEEAYDQIKDIAWPWTIQCWGDTEETNGNPWSSFLSLSSTTYACNTLMMRQLQWIVGLRIPRAASGMLSRPFYMTGILWASPWTFRTMIQARMTRNLWMELCPIVKVGRGIASPADPCSDAFLIFLFRSCWAYPKEWCRIRW